MKKLTRVRIIWMPKDKESFIGKEGEVTNWKPGATHIGVRLDNDPKEIALMTFQVARCK